MSSSPLRDPKRGFLMRLSHDDVIIMDCCCCWWWKGDADALLQSQPTGAVMIANNHNLSDKLSIILFIEIAPLYCIEYRGDRFLILSDIKYYHAADLRLLDFTPCLCDAAFPASCRRRCIRRSACHHQIISQSSPTRFQ